MNRRDAVLTIPAAIAAAVLIPWRKLKANPTSAGSRDIVTQLELQSVIDLQNLVEIRAAEVRRRLEAGARLEHGKLGACAWDREPLEDLGIGDATQADGFGILDIGPADHHRQFRDEVSQKHPDFADELAAVTWA